MQSDILQKLRREISDGITKESQVVYLMAGIRKILEQQESLEFGRLKFYCDWVLHTKLTGRPAQEVVRILQNVYECMAQGSRVSARSEAMLLIKFELLKDELAAFFEKYDLEDFTQGTNAWVVFMYLYSKVVEDCPLVMGPQIPVNLKKIVINVQTASEMVDDHLPYKVNWVFEARNDLLPATYFILNSYSTSQIGRI